MSPKRNPKADNRWSRTPAGLIVPRRPTLPTRRHIGKLGSAKDCCGDDCPICSAGNDTTQFDVVFGAGVFSSYFKTCCWDYFNGNTFRLDYYGTDPPDLLYRSEGSPPASELCAAYWLLYDTDAVECDGRAHGIELKLWSTVSSPSSVLGAITAFIDSAGSYYETIFGGAGVTISYTKPLDCSAINQSFPGTNQTGGLSCYMNATASVTLLGVA